AEIKFPEKAAVEDYRALMESYVRHYNEIRPHCALGYRTPKEVFEKTSALGTQIPDIAEMIEEAFMASGS
ncbi:MAG: integrase core domain-containing protein, partial [Bacteroidales bacterium]|nr:integrase core domain-containing protein [Bacteroidales bacterium]